MLHGPDRHGSGSPSRNCPVGETGRARNADNGARRDCPIRRADARGILPQGQ